MTKLRDMELSDPEAASQVSLTLTQLGRDLYQFIDRWPDELLVGHAFPLPEDLDGCLRHTGSTSRGGCSPPETVTIKVRPARLEAESAC